MLTLRRAPRAPAAVLALLLLTACSDGGAERADGDGGGGEPPAAEGRPEIEPPSGQPPESLVVEDLVEGDGEEADEGAVLTLHYVGLTWDGNEFASTWEHGQPLTYEYGQGRWVSGWETGLEGMRAGGRRRIVVPPELGYGNRGAPGVSPGDTLVFVVDLLEVG